MILAVNTESFVGCSLGEATAALATASSSAAVAIVLAVSPAEEAAARRVMSLPRPEKRGKGAKARAVSREINCDMEDEQLKDTSSWLMSRTEHNSGLSASAFEDFTVELEKEPGRGLGISVVGRRDGPGVFVSDMVSVNWISLSDFLYIDSAANLNLQQSIDLSDMIDIRFSDQMGI